MRIVSFFVFLIGIVFYANWYICILPLAYFLCNTLFPRSLNTFGDNIVNQVYQITLFVRFVFVPFLLIFSHKSNYYNTFYPLEENILSLSAMLMCGEIFISLLLVQIFLKKKFKKVEIEKENKYFLLFVSFIFIGIYFIDPSVVNNIKFIFSLESFSDDKYVSNGLSVIFSFILVTLPLFFLNFIKDSVFKNKLLLSLLLLLPFIFFIKGSSRLSFLIPIISWVYVLSILYPQYKKVILYSFSSLILLSVILLTLIKNFNDSEGSDFNINELTLYFNAYFSSIYNVSYSVLAYENYGNNFNYFFNDIFQNVVFLNLIVDRDQTTNFVFNRYIYGHSLWADQIVPVVGQSIFYFTYLGGWILTALLTLIMVFISNKLNKLDKISYIYIYSYMGCWVAASFNMLNISSVVSNFSNYFLPLLILLLCAKYLNGLMKK